MNKEIKWFIDLEWDTFITLNNDGLVTIATNGYDVVFNHEEFPALLAALEEVKEELVKRYGPIIDYERYSK